MRGALTIFHPSTQQAGIIPADAGSTHGSSPDKESDKDHPRGCGEHLPMVIIEDNC